MNDIKDNRKCCVGTTIDNRRPYVIVGKDDAGKELHLIAYSCPMCGCTVAWRDDGNDTVWLDCDNCHVLSYPANMYSAEDCEDMMRAWNANASAVDSVRRE
jgi:hypothetical protein